VRRPFGPDSHGVSTTIEQVARSSSWRDPIDRTRWSLADLIEVAVDLVNLSCGVGFVWEEEVADAFSVPRSDVKCFDRPPREDCAPPDWRERGWDPAWWPAAFSGLVLGVPASEAEGA